MTLSRRAFLAGAGAGVAVAGACSSGDSGGAGDPDLDLAAEAAGVEKLAWDHYVGTGLAVTEGRLGALLPPAVTGLLSTAADHHQHVHERWNAVLAGAGRPAVTDSPVRTRDTLTAVAIGVADLLAAVTLAVRLEDYACRIYQRALPALRSPEVVTLAAQVSVAGHQRQAAMRWLVGLDPLAGAPTDPDPRRFAGP